MKELSHLQNKMNSGENDKMFSSTKSSVSISKVKELQTSFLNNELWSLTFSGAFQRANVYGACTDKQKDDFKKGLRAFIEKEIYPKYSQGGVSGKDHLHNINALSEHSKRYAPHLQNGQINFGVSQKLVNLYLKYMWCCENIPTPPHFPVDRLIQEEFNKLARANKIKALEVKPWTQFTDSEHYLKVIEFADKLKGERVSIADFELEVFSRRGNKDS